MKLDKIQRDFLLETFFKDENFARWKDIAEELIDKGECVVAGEDSPWMGGIGTFITTKPTPDNYVGCCILTFDLEKFVNPDCSFFMEKHGIYIKQILAKKADIDTEVNSLLKMG